MADVHDLAALLFPAAPHIRGAVVESRTPRVRRGDIPVDASVVVWCWHGERDSLPRSLGGVVTARASAGVMKLAAPGGLRLIGRHEMAPRQFGRPGVRSALRSAVRAGMLLELSSLPVGCRLLDHAAGMAGLDAPVRQFHIGGGWSIVARNRCGGVPVIARIARQGGAGDPAPLVPTLRSLADAGVEPVPRLVAAGSTREASWLVEGMLPGSRPPTVTVDLFGDVVTVLARLPVDGTPASAVVDDLLAASEVLPERAAPLRRLAAQVGTMVRDVPGIMRHGDLWAGNLLVRDRRLSGVVDWDAAHPAGVPGSDLLHLVADEQRRRHGRSVGWSFRRQPWRSDEFRSVSRCYWGAVGVEPTPQHLELCGIAWWAEVVSGTLGRFGERAHDDGWLEDNVDSVLDVLSP